MTNPIQHYDWGSIRAIQELIGREDLIGTPCAELWMGAHPKAPSAVAGSAGPVALTSWIEAEPTKVLGHEVYAKFGAVLPFLFKVLAADRPLSIQAHPRKDQAEAGFDREDAAGVPRSAYNRNYRDRNHKPELICALTEFWALRGFRPIPEILEDVERIPSLQEPLEKLASATNSEGLAAFFRELMTLPHATLSTALAEARERFPASGEERYAWIHRLWAQHGEDIGVLAPLYLNTIRLSPGQALYLPAQTLHAYLSGVGVEIMANSDNVLRGGLTSKHVDVPELIAALSFEAERPPVLEPVQTSDGCGKRFPTNAEEFDLRRVVLTEGAPCELPETTGPRILLAVEGRAAAVADTQSSLNAGESLFAPAGHGRITLTGSATVFVAGVPA